MTLTGSAKQVAWGERIRADLLAEVATYRQRYAVGVYAYRAAWADEAAAFLAGVADARWFIDHRELGGNFLISGLVDEGCIAAVGYPR